MSGLEDQILSELMDELETDKLVLPSLPEVALKVRDAIEDDDVNTAKIAKVLITDPGLTARVIQVANSPLVRGAKEIDSVETAITRMGSSMVKNVVNGLIVQQMFQPTTEVSDQKFHQFWEHSTQVAAICHALAAFARLKPDQALLAGLMHDIGSLPIIKRAEDVPELLADVAMLDRIIMQAHTKIGEAMLKKWQLPAELIAVAAEHEHLQRDTDNVADYVDIVIAANLQSYIGENHPHAEVDLATIPALAKLGLKADVSIVDMEDTGESIRELQDALLNVS
ncbi:MAG: HDOD domain-containing protein [Gammaproteobacteria bacterium]|nr:HDOD domain-containing protein [Gammaproteobacteria bacterium]